MLHLDEGTIHAWLDGQLPREEAESVDAHVAECRQCADAVAEARGLIAASSRILMALDSVPRDVMPKSTSTAPNVAAPVPVDVTPAAPSSTTGASPARRRAARRWFDGPSLAAAAVIVVAIGTATLWRAGSRDEARTVRLAPELASGPSVIDSSVSASATSTAASPPTAMAPLASSAVNEPKPAANASADAIAPSEARRARAIDLSKRTANESARQGFADGRAGAQAASASGGRPTVGQAKVEEERSVRDELAKAKDAPPPVPVTAERREAITVLRGAKTEDLKRSRADSDRTTTAGAIRGRVTDANNTGISGAMVSVAGTAIGATTDSTGAFELDGVPTGTQRLNARRLGYAPLTRDVAIGANQTASTNIVLSPTVSSLQQVVVTSSSEAPPSRQTQAQAPSRAQERQRVAVPAPAPASDVAPGAAVTAQQSNAVGCYELGITPTSTASRTGFREVPRRVSLDSEIVPANADGIWYRARDLAQVGATPNGLWRPSGPEGIELEWTYGSRTARVRLAGQPTAMMRGTLEEIDRSTGTGLAGTVVAVRRACGG